jgi:uncharacterized protein YbjT (DUF2867 family)
MSFWSGRSVFVIGAAGFGGAHLCQELSSRTTRQNRKAAADLGLRG